MNLMKEKSSSLCVRKRSDGGIQSFRPRVAGQAFNEFEHRARKPRFVFARESEKDKEHPRLWQRGQTATESKDGGKPTVRGLQKDAENLDHYGERWMDRDKQVLQRIWWLGREYGPPKDEQNSTSTTADHDANLPTKDPSRAPAQPTKTFRKRRVATNYKPKPKSKTTRKKNETLSVGQPQEGHQSSEPAPGQWVTAGIADETLTPEPATTANGNKTKGRTRRQRKAKSKGPYEEGATRDLTEEASVYLEEEAPTGPTVAQVEMETVSVTPVVSEEVQAVTTTFEQTLSSNKVEEDPESRANSMPVFREEAPDFPYTPSTETSYSGSTLGSTPLFTPRSAVPPIGATTAQHSNLPQTVNFFWPSPYSGPTYTPNYYFGPQPFYSPSFVGLRQHPFGTLGTLQNPMISMGNTYGPPPGFTHWNDPQTHSNTHVDLPVSATHVSGLQARQPYSSYQAESGFAHQPAARHLIPPFEPVYPSLNDPPSHFLYDSYQFAYNPIPQS
ncbi:hypothetical protein FRC04_001599 [Tulasnella sp. 424]|nr:hypothetical protein FRC04_001599 [Tulasnella sp. 424]